MKDYIEFEKAKETAKTWNEEYNKCQEYTDSWYFYLDDGQTRMGGDTGIVVLKSGGNILRPQYYFMDDKRDFEAVGDEFDI